MTESAAATVDDPTSDERWQAGLDYAMEQFCHVLRVDPKDVTWDAATEELEGDVRAVIGNILRAKYGEDFDPKSPAAAPDLVKALDRLYRAYVSMLESGRDRIVFLGGDCDTVEVMEAGDPVLVATRAALAAAKDPASSRSTGEA